MKLSGTLPLSGGSEKFSPDHCRDLWKSTSSSGDHWQQCNIHPGHIMIEHYQTWTIKHSFLSSIATIICGHLVNIKNKTSSEDGRVSSPFSRRNIFSVDIEHLGGLSDLQTGVANTTLGIIKSTFMKMNIEY